MRKLIMMVGLFLLPLMVIQAHDQNIQPPIIALFQNKLYAVSAADGAATVLVEPPAGQTFLVRRFMTLSPDGKLLVYATQTDPESLDGYQVSLHVLDVATGTSELFQPGGGVFDQKPRGLNTFRLDYPTWSVDGSRLYYLRSELDARNYGKFANLQLAYYDLETRTHKLVARLDPNDYVADLMAAENGIIVRLFFGLGQPARLTLYGLDNRVVSKTEIANTVNDSLRYKGQDYYAVGNNYGGISTLVNVETGESRSIEGGYYPAWRSRLAGEQSMHIFRFIGQTGTWYDVTVQITRLILAKLPKVQVFVTPLRRMDSQWPSSNLIPASARPYAS